MKPVRLLLPAELELVGAAKYYESQAPGLGGAFLDKIDSAIRDIETNPERWPVIRNNIRRRLVHRFPYAVLYLANAEEIVVLAIAHLQRRPDYWVNRV